MRSHTQHDDSPTWLPRVDINVYGQEIKNIRAAANDQAQKYSETLSLAIDQAVRGQTIAAKIIHLLGKIKSGTSREVLQDLLDDILPDVAQQVDQSKRLVQGFEEISQGLHKVRARHL